METVRVKGVGFLARSRIGGGLVCVICVLGLVACGGKDKGGGGAGKGGLISGTDPQNKDCETALTTNPITVKELEPIAKANGLDPEEVLAKIKEICKNGGDISSVVDKAINALKPAEVSALPPSEAPPEEVPPPEAPPAEPPPEETPPAEPPPAESGSGEGYCVESGPGAFAPGCQGEIVPNPPSGTG